MDHDLYERLSRIHANIIQLCAWLNEKRDFDTASRLLPIMDDLTHLLAVSSMTKNRQEMI
jgi:hypothetical protein